MASSTGSNTGMGHGSHEDTFGVDIEQKVITDGHLMNDTVKTFSWNGITVTVKDNKTGEPKAILDDVHGIAQAGQ
jgi:hypothetical protein